MEGGESARLEIMTESRTTTKQHPARNKALTIRVRKDTVRASRTAEQGKAGKARARSPSMVVGLWGSDTVTHQTELLADRGKRILQLAASHV
jgi:hypothetical protein